MRSTPDPARIAHLSGRGFTIGQLLRIAAALGGAEEMERLSGDPKGVIAQRVEELERTKGRKAEDVLTGKTPPPRRGPDGDKTPKEGSEMTDRPRGESREERPRGPLYVPCEYCKDGTAVPADKLMEHQLRFHPDEVAKKLAEQKATTEAKPATGGSDVDPNKPKGNPENVIGEQFRIALDMLESRNWDVTKNLIDSDKPQGKVVSVDRIGDGKVRLNVSKGKPEEKTQVETKTDVKEETKKPGLLERIWKAGSGGSDF